MYQPEAHLFLKLKDPIVSLVTTVKVIAKTMFVKTDVSYKISFSFSLLCCHKDMQNKKFYIIKTQSEEAQWKPPGL